jgi:hypothetical protein
LGVAVGDVVPIEPVGAVVGGQVGIEVGPVVGWHGFID